ncbi:MAG: peptidyl-prolyl cis-trans isomerase [Krumholzibacteria bacterium]|nr:peptidyl-prolyl cis-trans isomerase [Candidatus Krumholzibacteria bacterium]
MPAVHRLVAVPCLLLPLLLLAACGGGQEDASFAWQPVFGDNFADTTPVVARVAGVEITEQDIDLRLDEMPPNVRSRYKGAEGRRLLLKDMVDQALLVRGAVDLKLYNHRDVARTLISQRRSTLDAAMRGVGLLEKAQPTEQDLRDFFMQHRDRYRQLGTVRARHIECRTQADAEAAYRRLQGGGPRGAFPYVVAEYSVNEATKQREGDLGSFNRGGFVPDVTSGAELSRIAYDMADGLNPPVQIAGRWHVIEVLRRTDERPMTFAEARDTVAEDIKPSYQEQLVRDWLTEARTTYPAEMFGEYAPGRGLSADEIFARAMALPDNQDKIDLYLMIVTEFPASDRVDDALFMVSQAYMDLWGDRRSASIYLKQLVDNHPDSELLDDAQYLLENLDNPSALAPKSIDELRR